MKAEDLQPLVDQHIIGCKIITELHRMLNNKWATNIKALREDTPEGLKRATGDAFFRPLFIYTKAICETTTVTGCEFSLKTVDGINIISSKLYAYPLTEPAVLEMSAKKLEDCPDLVIQEECTRFLRLLQHHERS